MQNFYSKILLVGEYSILKGSSALTVPYKQFSAVLQFPNNNPNQYEKESNNLLAEFLEYLSGNNIKWNLLKLRRDIEKGLFLDSSIPQAYGLGSSGAVVASLFQAYKGKSIEQIDLLHLKKELAKAESFFHGKSSGIDPLSILLRKPLLVTKNRIEIIESEILSQRTRRFYMFDTEMVGGTFDLVANFNKLFASTDFKKSFDEDYLPIINSIIDDLISGNIQKLREMMNHISAFQLKNFSKMIPQAYYAIWQKGIETKDYYFKLCGSGGGGYLLVYSDMQKAKLEKLLQHTLLSLDY